jgi:serine/threonine-protein kinase
MISFSVPPPGDLVAGKYRIEAPIGSGGMGVVLAAMHIELGHLVAVKVMRPESSPYHVERFRREARIVAKLQSEHVARVTDFGQLPAGSPYVVMDYLEGRDLDQELKARGPLPIEEAVSHVLCACEAIAEAHRFGIVHRDIKPKNLFLARRAGGLPVLKVLDFGLAKVDIREDPSITGSQDIFGSPAYMAPEQMRSAKDVDARADIWALGVTLYELIAGEGPFEAPSVPEICAMVLKEAPPPLRAKRADVTAELAKVVHRCLAKDPDDRYATILDLAEALEPFAPTTRDGFAKRIEAIVTAPRSDPSLPPPAASAISSPSQSDSPTNRLGNSEELTVEMDTSPRYSVDTDTKTRAIPRSRRRATSIAGAAAAIAIVGGGAMLVTRPEVPHGRHDPSAVAPLPLAPLSPALAPPIEAPAATTPTEPQEAPQPAAASSAATAAPSTTADASATMKPLVTKASTPHSTPAAPHPAAAAGAKPLPTVTTTPMTAKPPAETSPEVPRKPGDTL